MDKKVLLLDESGDFLSEDKRTALFEYARFVMLYNKHFNLTGAKSADDFFKNQILDTLCPAPFFEDYKTRTIYDIGSGVGLPGIALAIYFDKANFVLVERSTKRANFLRSAVAHLALENRVRVENKELSALKGQVDVATFRALGAFGAIESELYASLADSGICLCYKGRLSEAVSEKVSPEYFSRRIEPYSFSGKERCMVILNKISR